MVAGAEEFVCIPANVPHLPCNTSHTEHCTTLISRTDPNEQESVVLMPELKNPRLKCVGVDQRQLHPPNIYLATCIIVHLVSCPRNSVFIY